MPMASESGGSNLGAALGGGAMDFGGIAANFAGGAIATSKAYDRTKNMMTRGMIYQRKGLEDAGFNPLLALGSMGGIGGASAKVPHQVPNAQTKAAQLTAGSQRALMASQSAKAAEEARWTKMRNDYYENTPNAVRDFVTNESTPNDAAAMILKAIKGYMQDNPRSSAEEQWLDKVAPGTTGKALKPRENWYSPDMRKGQRTGHSRKNRK